MSKRKTGLRPGDELRKALEGKGISQKRLAEHIGISRPYLSDMIRGTRHISARMALLFERALGINAAILLSIQRDAELAAVDPSEYRGIRRL